MFNFASSKRKFTQFPESACPEHQCPGTFFYGGLFFFFVVIAYIILFCLLHR